MGIKEMISYSGPAKEEGYHGITQSPYIACLINDLPKGVGVLGIGQRTGIMDLDMLSGFFLALGIFSDDIKGFSYSDSVVVSRHEGSRLEAWLIADKNGSVKLKRDRQELSALIEGLEENWEFLKRIDQGKGDIRGVKEFNFDVVKRFPFNTVKSSDRYCPVTTAKIEQLEREVPYCKGGTSELFGVIIPALDGKKSIEEVMDLFDGKVLQKDKPVEESDVLGVIDSLFNYDQLSFETRILEGDKIRLIKPFTPGQAQHWGEFFSVGEIITADSTAHGYWNVLNQLVKSGQAEII